RDRTHVLRGRERGRDRRVARDRAGARARGAPPCPGAPEGGARTTRRGDAMTERCRNPIELGELAAYQLGELDADRERAIEEHYFGCSACSARLSWLGALSQSIAEEVRAGRVSSNVSSAWVKRAAEGGMRLRSYELRAG